MILTQQAVLSGARTDRACKLHMPASELFRLYQSTYGGRIRQLVQEHPALRAASSVPWAKMTKLQKNVEVLLGSERADPAWVVKSRRAETFWQVVDDLGIHFIVDSNPTDCTYHRNGPVWEKELDEIKKQLAAHPSAPQRISLEREQKLKAQQVENYKRHQKQYEVKTK